MHVPLFRCQRVWVVLTRITFRQHQSERSETGDTNPSSPALLKTFRRVFDLADVRRLTTLVNNFTLVEFVFLEQSYCRLFHSMPQQRSLQKSLTTTNARGGKSLQQPRSGQSWNGARYYKLFFGLIWTVMHGSGDGNKGWTTHRTTESQNGRGWKGPLWVI